MSALSDSTNTQPYLITMTATPLGLNITAKKGDQAIDPKPLFGFVAECFARVQGQDPRRLASKYPTLTFAVRSISPELPSSVSGVATSSLSIVPSGMGRPASQNIVTPAARHFVSPSISAAIPSASMPQSLPIVESRGSVQVVSQGSFVADPMIVDSLGSSEPASLLSLTAPLGTFASVGALPTS